jgi:sRNA-binding protein
MANLKSRFTRDEHEQVIHMLCDHYPKCFFEDPRQRRPLKKNIAADIAKDPNFKVDPDRIVAAVDWYKSHISYDYALAQTGVKRIDLSGVEVGTVTESEAIAARQAIAEKGTTINTAKNPIRTLNQMHTTGKISDDGLRKVDAPMLPRTKTATIAPELAPLYEVLGNANTAVASISDPTMRAAVLKTLLDVVITAFQQARKELDVVD